MYQTVHKSQDSQGGYCAIAGKFLLAVDSPCAGRHKVALTLMVFGAI
jgi:hypothetical protein